MHSQTPLSPWLQSVHHDGSAAYVSNPAPGLGETARLRLRLAHDAPVRGVYLRTFPDGEQMITPLQQTAVSPATQWWEGTIVINQPAVHYRFILQAEDGVWHYNAAGSSAAVPLDTFDFRLLADYEAPGWLETAVFYQIFPDRFANSDPSLDPQPEEYEHRGHRPHTYPWGVPPPPEQPFPLVFYGGDLPGLIEKLDYLEDLGVNALYLNPLFTAYSNHRYDVADYEHVDPHLGGDAALIALREAFDERGMRYLLDIVPNHCGYWHPWFQTARQNPAAAEANYFTFHDHPDEYATWLGVWTLPKLNYRSEALRRRMYAAPGAIFRRWLRPPFAADGWRVDVANMLGRQGATQLGVEAARGIRRAVKETRQDAYLLGENFFDATPSLQDGDQWDGVMNYAGFTFPLLHWLAGYRQGAWELEEPITADVPWPTAALAAAWQQHLAAIPWAIALQQFNLLGSHDTPRVRTLLGENDALGRLAATVLFTFPGIPCVYYGEEIGMVDLPQLEQRGCMPWDEAAWNHDLRDFYQKLIKLRRETAVLARGGFQILSVAADTIAYQRETEEQRALVVAHRAATARPAGPLPLAHGGIPDGARFVEQFSGGTAVVQHSALPLPAQLQGASLWLYEFQQTEPS